MVAIERIVDTVPLSRNENMAGFMHRCGICEERGSGFDKVIAATQADSLMAPKIESQNHKRHIGCQVDKVVGSGHCTAIHEVCSI